MDGASQTADEERPAPSVAPGAPPVPDGSAMPRLRAGDHIGSRFEVQEFLREDLLGQRYAALDQKSGKQVTLLMLAPEVGVEKAAAARLRSESRLATELAHKNITRVFGMGKEGEQRYVAREFVDGQTLADLLEKKAAAGKSFSVKGAYNLVAHLCNAVDGARATMAHETLRPSAVLINRTGRVKVADFGLGALRPALVAGRDQLSRWDAPCLQDEGTDDLAALGQILFALLAGAPATERVPKLPEAAAKALPEQLADVLRRALDMTAKDRFADASAFKAELLRAVETAAGVERPPEPLAPSGSSIEILDEGRATNHGFKLPDAKGGKRRAPPPPADGGFVIPDLKPAGDVEDDGSTARWLIERDGTDYGPFTINQVKEQLFEEKLTVENTLYDIETDRRLSVSEFSAFDEIVLEWAHEKAARTKRRAEEVAAAAARRRNRILLSIVAFLVIGVGGTVGGFMWYRASLPTPQKANLSGLMLTMKRALPSVSLPEELPETQAEIKARNKAAADAAATKRAIADQRRIAEEARLAESSELNADAPTGRKFDRAAFDQAMAKRQAKLVACLTAEAKRDPNLQSLTVKVTILPNGRVISPQMTGGSRRGESCVRGALGGMTVPSFDGTNVKVSLPFQIR